ncbi:MAG: sugar phosphate isomerase/epimerase family protein [Bacteroidota bacterium]
MKKQKFELRDDKIKAAFEKLKKEHPERLKNRLNLSWSNWGFGLESLEDTLARLSKNGVEYIELHGNHYGPNMGYNVKETLALLDKYNMKVSGTCGMFSTENDLSSNKPQKRQAAIDYIKRELVFTKEVGGHYLLVVPGAVGRPNANDSSEFFRSSETLRQLGSEFERQGIKAAIEPIRSAEVSLCHTVKDAKNYIKAVAHPAINHINGDVYHMFTEEDHIGEALLDAGELLTNLHMADSNRCALGDGFMNLDIIIMSLYLIGYNTDGKYVTPEPLGPGGDPYPAMNSIPDQKELDELVEKSITYFRERESALCD